MLKHALPTKSVVLVMLATTASLVARAVLQLELMKNGYSTEVAADLSYLVVPPVLLFLTIPIWREALPDLAQQYDIRWLTPRTIVFAILLGLALRLVQWCYLFMNVSFGWILNEDPNAIIGPVFFWRCDPLPILALGLLVSAITIPVIEEIVHRAYVFRALLRFGLPTAVLASSLIFAVYHKIGTWPIATAAGIVFAIVYFRSGSLWPSTIAHASFNAASQIDWRCLRGHWNPTEDQLPLPLPGIAATSVLLVLIAIIAWIVRYEMPETPRRSGHSSSHV